MLWLALAGGSGTAPWKSQARNQACWVGNQDAKKTCEMRPKVERVHDKDLKRVTGHP